MAKKQVWGAQLLWTLGVALVLAAGLLLQGDDRWILLGVGVLLLVMEVQIWRPLEAKRGLVEVIAGGVLTITAMARLVESVGQSFTAHHVYRILALVGSLFILIEGVKRGQTGPEVEQ